ncbi:hypothetical protein [Pantoea sp. Z09]|uniref:hypothetical protein n=1 Tax=Pantoea sp. Z09 TaxID=2886821 RepID=UPI001EFE0C18|nr:hypothetical protein [Pantoea sp. Z09]
MKKSFWLVPGIVFVTVFFGMKDLLGGGCADGWHSSSIGMQGACSHHGGVGSGGGISLISALALAGYSFYRLDKAEAEKNRRNYQLSKQNEWLRLDLTSAPFNPQEHYSITGNALSYTYVRRIGSDPESLAVTISDADSSIIEKLALALASQSHATSMLVLDGLDVSLTMNLGEITTFQAHQISDIASLGNAAVLLIETLDKHLPANA